MIFDKLSAWKSIRTRLLLLILLVLIPALVLVLKSNVDQQRLKKDQVRQRVTGTTKVAAANEEQLINRTRQILETLQGFSFLVLSSNRAFSDFNFKNLTLLSPDYLDFGLIEPDGTLFSSAKETNRSPNLSTTAVYRAVRERNGFAMGGLDDLSGSRDAVSFGMPVNDEKGELRRIVYASLKLNVMHSVLTHIPVTTNGIIMLISPDGMILGRHPSPSTWVGRNVAKEKFTETLLKTKSGVFEMNGLDGIERLYASETISDENHPLLYVTIGFPLKSTFAEANQDFYSNLGTLIALAVVLLAAAWLISNKLLLEPINAVISASIRLADGDLTARTGLKGSSEIHQLASNFDRMAESLALRDAELKRAHQEIVSMNADLERKVEARTIELSNANQELEAFSYSVSHDVRAPLSSIAGFSEILFEDYARQLSPAGLSHVNRIRKSVVRLQRLVDDLLRFARLGKQGLKLQMTDLNMVVREVIAGFERELAGRDVTFDVTHLPTIECDRGLVTQVFWNLIANAIKFTGPRQHAVISIGETSQQGETVLFVRDNGVGFNMKNAGKLFGAFQRLHRHDDFEGTGVGLATAQQILLKHQGRIWAHAEPDRGATFYFKLEPEKRHGTPTALMHV